MQNILERPEDVYGRDQGTNKNVDEVSSMIPSGPSFDETLAFSIEWQKSLITNATVCRFHNACLTRTGTVLLHPQLQQYDSFLSSQCKILNLRKAKYRFMNSSAEFNTTSFSSHFDLFVIFFPRSHMPHFIKDFFGHIGLFDVITDRSSNVERFCMNEHGNNTCSKPGFTYRFAWFVPDTYRKRLWNWVPQFLTIFSEYWFFYSREQWLRTSDEGIACFKSIIQPVRFGRLHSADWIKKTALRTITAEVRNIPRWSLNTLLSEIVFGYKTCRANILIVNRKQKNGRSIANLKEVVEVVKRVLRKVRLSSTASNESITSNAASTHFRTRIIPSIKTVYFEDLPFLKQAEHVMHSDLIIGTHGAGLTNVIFARNGTLIYEIFPFMYNPPNFFHLSRWLDLNYSSTVANPDTDTFLHCIERSKRRMNISMDSMAIPMWSRATDLMKKDRKNHLQALMSDPYYKSYTEHIRQTSDSSFRHRVCLRAQNLEVELNEFEHRMKVFREHLCKDSIS